MTMRFWSVALTLLVFSQTVSAEITGKHQDSFTFMWDADVDGKVSKLFLLDLDGDGDLEVVTDSVLTTSYGKSGIVYALDHSGGVLWRYHAGLLNDLHASDSGSIAVGTGGHVVLLNPDGSVKWKRSVRTSIIQRVYAQSVYAGDLDGDGVDEVVSASNFGFKGSVLQVWSNGGEKLAKIDYRGNRFPAVITAADLDNDSVKELIVGVILYAPNTIAGTINPAYSKPALMQVLSLDGSVSWEVETPSGVSSLGVSDLDGDGAPEVLVGVEGRLIVYSASGSEVWYKEISGRLRAMKLGDINDDGKPEVVVGAGRVSVRDGSGNSLWRYNTGTVFDVDVVDLDGDNKREVVAASQEIRVLDSAGSLLWKSDRIGKIMSVEVADMQSDGYPEIVSGGDDNKLSFHSTEKYGREVRAASYYAIADSEFKKRDYNASKYNALKAKEYYDWLSDAAGSTKSQNLALKCTTYMGADGYYNLSLKYLDEANYGNASYYAEKALEEYRKVQDLRMLNQVNSILNRGRLYPSAVNNLNISRYYYAQNMWENASFYAGKAKEQFSYIGVVDGVGEAETLLTKSQKQVKALQYIEMALNHSLYGEYVNASHYLDIANRTYAEINDTAGVMKVGELMATVGDEEHRGNVLIYSGYLLLAVILLLTGFISVRVLKLVLKHKPGHDIGDVWDMFQWLRWKPEDDKSNRKNRKGTGLRGL